MRKEWYKLWMRTLRKLRDLSWPDRFLLLETLLWLAVSRLALLAVPFKYVAPHLGTHLAETGRDLDPHRETLVLRIGWAVRLVAPHTPWQSTCLAQAIAASWLLRRRGIPSTLYLGLAKDAADQWQAHAWLRCGPHILTGDTALRRFAIVSTFAKPAD